MDRTPARRRRSRNQTGVVARLLTPRMTQPTNLGQPAGASRGPATGGRGGGEPPPRASAQPFAAGAAGNPAGPATSRGAPVGPAPMAPVEADTAAPAGA